MSAGAFCRDCGWKTSAEPGEGTIFATMSGGTMKFIRGRVYYPDGTPAKNIVVEVYRNRLGKVSIEDVSYKQVKTIISRERIAARLILKGGRFCFRNLPAGKYLLRIGSRDDPQFSAMNVFVTVAPKSQKYLRRGLKVDLAMSI